MDESQLEARRTSRGPYTMVPYQDETKNSHPMYVDEFGPETPGNIPPLRRSNSMAKCLHAEVEFLDSGSKLLPKPFHQASVSKCIWIHVATATSALVMILIPVGLLMFALNSNSRTPFNGPHETYCTLPNFYPTNPLGFSTLFNVDTAFGSLSFGTAKFIDLVWDVGFSRCGQAMLGWITYRVNTSALLRIMETQPVSYELFSTLSLSWSSVASLTPVIKAIFKPLGFRKRLILLWIMLNIFWVAFWPTITNAMTGYIAKNNTLVKLQGEDGYVNFGDIGSISNLAFQFYTENSISGNWSNTPTGPILLSTGPNITLWSEFSQILENSNDMAANIRYSSSATNDELVKVFYYYGNQTYYWNYFEDTGNVQCVATGIYQWGFASLGTSAFAILNGLWVIGTYGVWIHMNRKSTLCQKGRRLGTHRAAIDLVESIHQDLGKNICAYSEQELAEELSRKGGIKYYVEHREGDTPSHIGITSSKDKGPVSLRFGVLYGHLRGRKS